MPYDAEDVVVVVPYGQTRMSRLVNSCITYTVAVLTYKIRTSSTLSYLSDVLHPVTSLRSSRSVDTRRLQTQWTRTELGRCAFSVAAPTVWNSLPAQLRLSGSLPTFTKHFEIDIVHWCFKSLSNVLSAPLYPSTWIEIENRDRT